MSRRNKEAAEQAAQQASEAGRILQAQRGREEEPTEPTEPSGPRPEPRNEPRRLGMQEITDRHERTMNGVETPVVADPAPPSPDEMLAAQHAAQQPVEVTEQPEAIPEVPPQVPPQTAETVRVKVDGEVFDVPKAEVDEAGGLIAYQKIRAAEGRVSKLQQSISETKQQQAQMLQWFQSAAQQQTPKPTYDQLINQKIDVIRYGTPEESAAAMREVLETAVSANRVDPNAIEQRTLLKFSMMTAADTFRKEFADVLTNPMMATLAAVEEQKRLSTLQSLPTDWNQFYRSIGNELRALVSPKQQYQPQETQPATQTADHTSQQQPSNTSPAPSVKEARKASIVALPTAASRAELPKETKPETRDDVLNGMKKSRGIPIG
jgi:hypothetical protein